MALVLETKPNFEKCGEILTASSPSERLFELKCLFCSAAFGNLPQFVDHFKEEHLEISLKIEETESNWKPADNFYDCKYEFDDSTTFTETMKEIQEKDIKVPIEFDPLNEPVLKLEDFTTEKPDESSEPMHFANEASENSENECKSNDDSLEIDTESDREVTLALIVNYKELPVLWNNKHSHYKTSSHRLLALKKLANNLTIQFGKQFQYTEVERQIKQLRKYYAQDLFNQKAAIAKGRTYKPIWFFDKLDFIVDTNDLIQENYSPFSSSKLPHLTEKQQIQMIEIYESFPCLWNTTLKDYRFKKSRKAAMKSILKAVEEKVHVKLKENHLNRRLYRIRQMCTKEKTRQLKCERLDNDYKPECKFYEKVKFLYDHVNPFQCSHCQKMFKAYDQYQKHLATHSGADPFSCPICKKGFNNFAPLNLHIRRHKKDYEFECETCSKRFISAGDLSVHSRVHTGEKPFCCEICGRSFAQENSFKRHKKYHEKRYSHICELCNKGFYDGNSLTEHMNIHLNVRDKICNVCGKAFTTNAYLRKHKETHMEKKYKCKICSKSFAQYAGLFTHMKMH